MPRQNDHARPKVHRGLTPKPKAPEDAARAGTVHEAKIYVVEPPERNPQSVTETPIRIGVYAHVVHEEALLERLVNSLNVSGLHPLEHTVGIIVGQRELRRTQALLNNNGTAVGSSYVARVERSAAAAARHPRPEAFTLGRLAAIRNPTMPESAQGTLAYLLDPQQDVSPRTRLRTDLLKPLKRLVHEAGHDARGVETLAVPQLILPIAAIDDIGSVRGLHELNGQNLFPEVRVLVGSVAVTHEVGYPTIAG